jgi:signal transduction histidine kinase
VAKHPSADPERDAAASAAVPWYRRLGRGWRVRTLIPVLVIHALAFTSLYLALYELTMAEVDSTHRHAAERSLDVLATTFKASRAAPALLVGHDKIRAFLSNRGPEVISLFGPSGALVATNQRTVDPLASLEAATAISEPMSDTRWFTRSGNGHVLSGVRLLRNEASCRGCHGSTRGVLGAIQLTHDVSSQVDSAARRIRLRLGLLVAVWGLLVVAMARFKDVVIGRPLERIERALARAAPHPRARSGDLDDLATRLDETIWAVLEQHKARERNVNDRLARAGQLAMVGELAASLTHEIRSPLAGISAALDALLADGRGAGTERAANDVYRRMKSEIERTNNTLSGLLSLARPRAPRRALVHMARVAEEVVALFRPRLASRKIGLDLDAPAGVPVIELDRGMMTQLLLNLLTNALQAIEGEGRIRVSVRPFPSEDGVVLTVADTGRGIPPEDLEKILEPFYTTREHGTGLGLPICRQIVEAHEGAIEIKSELGAGTSVVVFLPGRRAKGEVADAARTAG